MTCAMDNYLGAYVLDALEPDESVTVQAHLTGCDTCRDEVGSLASVVSMLSLVSVDDIVRIEGVDDLAGASPPPSPAVLERVLTSVSSERRRRRSYKIAALAVGAAAVVAIAVGSALPSEHPSTSTVHAVDATTHASAAVTITHRSWGTELELTLRGAYPGGRCSLVAHARDGRTDTAATWVASARGAATVPGATSIAAPQLSELDVVTATGQRLVQLVMPHHQH